MTTETTTKDPVWKRLHFDPTINLGHILTTILLFVSVIAWGQSVETRITTVHVEIANLKEEDKKQMQERQVTRQELREDLKEIKTEIKTVSEQVRQINTNKK